MSDAYLKCSCRACGGHIEFPSNAVGISVACPHCGGTTDLHSAAVSAAVASPAPPVRPASAAPPPRPQSSLTPSIPSGGTRLQVSAPPPPPPVFEEADQEVEFPVNATAPVNWMGWSLASVAVLLFVIGGVMYLNNARQGKSSIFPDRSRAAAVAKGSKEQPSPEAEDADANRAPAATTAQAPGKSIDDLKVSPIVLRRTSGSTLVYAIGSVRNNSDQQRFGVSLELDLLDAADKKIGTAKDYAKVIEPRKDWRFRALVVAPKTATVKLAKIHEDE